MKCIGYYLKEIIPVPSYICLPVDKLLSVSSCISVNHPPMYPNKRADHKFMKQYRDMMDISQERLNELLQYTDALLGKKQITLDGCFLHEADAKHARAYLSSKRDIKVIGISIDEKYLSLLRDVGEFENMIVPDYEDTDGMFLGYEILGYEMGSFHSYLCNNLEKTLREKFTVEFTSCGLIKNSIREIEFFCNYIRNMGEPVRWIPVAVYDCGE